MSALKRFALAIDLASRRRDQAAQELLLAQQSELFARDRMAQLQNYAVETETKWISKAQCGTGAELLRHQSQFMNRLQQAIGLQDGVLAQETRKVGGAKEIALAAEYRLVNLKQVVKKKHADVVALQARHEQKQMDEFAAQRSRQTLQALSSGERA